MTKKYLIVALSITVLAIGSLALNSPASHKTKAQSSSTQSRIAPDHVIYRMLLHHVFLFNQKAEEAEQQGKHDSAAAFRRAFRQQAALNDEHALILNEIAADCEREVREQDAKAKIIIDARRAAYPDGKIPPGAKPLPPSPELEAMQQERNAIILRARDRLHAALGEQEWARFQEFVRQQVAPRITMSAPLPPEPSAPVASVPDSSSEPHQ